MIELTYDNKIVKVFEHILYVSPYLKSMHEEYNEPIPLLNANDKIFGAFNSWFEYLCDALCVCHVEEDEHTKIYYPYYFKRFETKFLIEMFNFGLSNQIKILCNTIAYVLRRSNVLSYENKSYLNNGLKIVNGKIENENFEISYTLFKMINEFKKHEFNKKNNLYHVLTSNFFRNLMFRYDVDYEFIKIIYNLWSQDGFNIIGDEDFKQLYNFAEPFFYLDKPNSDYDLEYSGNIIYEYELDFDDQNVWIIYGLNYTDKITVCKKQTFLLFLTIILNKFSFGDRVCANDNEHIIKYIVKYCVDNDFDCQECEKYYDENFVLDFDNI